MILGYTSLMNEVNILKQFKSFDVNGISKDSDDVLIIEMIKVNSSLVMSIITLKINLVYIFIDFG